MIAITYYPDAQSSAECRQANAGLAGCTIQVAAGREAGENLCVDP